MKRLIAFAVDWFVIAAWGGLLFGAVMLATNGSPPRPSGPWMGQAIGFLSMTLSVALYVAICESSAMRASFGKRALGLIVTSAAGARLPFGTAFLRTAIKFLPWEFGHLVAQQAAFSASTGRTPYDTWTASRVVPRAGN